MAISKIKLPDNSVQEIHDARGVDAAGSFYFVQGSSSAAGSSKSGSYLSVKWEGSIPGVSAAYNGLKIAYRIATRTGINSAGVVLSIDNGAHYYPVVLQTNTMVTTHYPVGTTFLAVFNSTQTATAYLTAGEKSTVTGCWQIMEYDANTNTQLRSYISTNDEEYPITARYTNTTGSTYYQEYGRYSDDVTLNPSTNTITASGFKVSGGTSSQFLKADGSVDSNSYATTSQLPTTVTESTVSGWGFTKNTGTLTGVKFNGASASVSGGVASITATIPPAPGTLNTTATATQSTSSNEALSGNVTLHKISKTGSYEDLNSKPSFPAAVYYDPATEMLYFFKSTADKDSFVANKTQTNLILFSTETSPYIKFKDSVIANVCATTWGDGTGITEMRASKSLSMANAFKNNTDITSFDELKYFTGITSLENAFQNSSLTKVTLPSGIVVGNSNNWVNIFNGCASLLEVDFSDFMRDETNTVAQQRTYSFFAGCSSLTILRYSSIEQINNIVVDKYLTTPTATDAPFQANNDVHYVYINGDELRDLIIPSTMTEIASGAFLGFNRITSVEFPSTLTRIGSFAFSGCSSLTKVEVPVAIIWRGAFTNCANLEEIIFTANISSWPGSCCDGCNALKKVVFTSITNIPNSTYFMNFSKTLDYLEFGASITSIGTWFLGTTVHVKTFVCRATTPPETGSGRIFYNRPTKIYVPYSSDHSVLNAYKTATNWSSWASYIFELNSDGSVPE